MGPTDGSKDKSDDEWKKMVNEGSLTPQQYFVLRHKATEPAGVTMSAGGFDDHEDTGTYVCAGCKTPVYTSAMKFDCGCGWPGFYGNIEGAVYEVSSTYCYDMS